MFFGLSPGEVIFTLGVLTLLIGPKEMPVIARTLGRVSGQAVAYAAKARSSFLAAGRDGEIAQLHQEVQESLRQLTQIRNELRSGMSLTNPGPLTSRLLNLPPDPSAHHSEAAQSPPPLPAAGGLAAPVQQQQQQLRPLPQGSFLPPAAAALGAQGSPASQLGSGGPPPLEEGGATPAKLGKALGLLAGVAAAEAEQAAADREAAALLLRRLQGLEAGPAAALLEGVPPGQLQALLATVQEAQRAQQAQERADQEADERGEPRVYSTVATSPREEERRRRLQEQQQQQPLPHASAVADSAKPEKSPD